MRKFIGKTFCFLIGFFLVAAFCMWLSSTCPFFNKCFAFITCSNEYSTDEEDSRTEAILKAKSSDNNYTKLICGDSVSNFMFSQLQPYNDDYAICSTARPFTMAGQYCIIKEFLEAHPDATDVYMFFSLDSWETVYDAQCGYQQSVVPIIRAGVYDDLDQSTKEDLEKKYFKLLLQPWAVNMYHDSLMNHKIVLNGIVDYHEKVLGEDCSAMYVTTNGEISPLSKEYLDKIIALCKDKNVTFHLMHDPLADTDVKHAELKEEKKIFKNAGYDDYTDLYFDSVLFYPANKFVDGVHLGLPGQPEIQLSAIEDIIEETGLMTDLVVREK